MFGVAWFIISCIGWSSCSYTHYCFDNNYKVGPLSTSDKRDYYCKTSYDQDYPRIDANTNYCSIWVTWMWNFIGSISLCTVFLFIHFLFGFPKCDNNSPNIKSPKYQYGTHFTARRTKIITFFLNVSLLVVYVCGIGAYACYYSPYCHIAPYSYLANGEFTIYGYYYSCCTVKGYCPIQATLEICSSFYIWISFLIIGLFAFFISSIYFFFRYLFRKEIIETLPSS